MKLVEDFLDFHMFENILTSKTPYMRKANNEMQCTLVILRGLQKVNTSETQHTQKEPADIMFPEPQHDSLLDLKINCTRNIRSNHGGYRATFH